MLLVVFSNDGGTTINLKTALGINRKERKEREERNC